jgi:hypothetical protein
MPLLALAPVVAFARYCWAICTNPARAWRIAVGFDQLANVAANGDEDETISSRAAKARHSGKRWGCVLCRILDAIDPGHCDKNIEADEGSPMPGTEKPPEETRRRSGQSEATGLINS